MTRILCNKLRVFFVGLLLGVLCAVPAVFVAGTPDTARKTASLKAARALVQDLQKQPGVQFTSKSICDGRILGTQEFVQAIASRRQDGVFDTLYRAGAVQNLWTNQICLRDDALDLLDRS